MPLATAGAVRAASFGEQRTGVNRGFRPDGSESEPRTRARHKAERAASFGTRRALGSGELEHATLSEELRLRAHGKIQKERQVGNSRSLDEAGVTLQDEKPQERYPGKSGDGSRRSKPTRS
jgi:hypothetical protein